MKKGFQVSTKTLVEKIEALPADKRAEVEDFVEFVAARSRPSEPAPKRFADELLKRIDDRRERLFREHGLFPDSTEIIRELRENGA